MHTYEVRPRKDHRGVDLISDALPFGRLWYDTPDNAIGYAMHRSRSHPRLRRDWRRNRDARAQGRFQRTVKCHVMINGLRRFSSANKLHSLMAAFPRRVFGKRDRRVTDPRTDRA